MEYHLQVPLREEDILKLRIGDIVYFSGEAFTCRSRLQKAVLDDGWELPFSAEGRNVLIHCGPVVVKENGRWKALSFGPTSSVRFEKWGSRSIEKWGLKAIIGKGTMGKKTQSAMKKNTCIHACPMGIKSHETLSKGQVTIKDVYWEKELGSIEAAWIVEMNNFGPFLVDIDTNGDNYFDLLDETIKENKKAVFEYLNIPLNFEYTELY